MWLVRRVPALGALREYSWGAFGRDATAGLTVATVAVPQAMAYASLAGLPPQYGLYTAIVMTAVGALLDSSRLLINGPTNAISIALLVGTAALAHPVLFLASLFSFGVLLAFTAAQLAVIKLRFSEPTRRRPYRVPFTVGRIPVPSVVGAVLTFTVWLVAIDTHEGARLAGPAWLGIGLILYIVVRKSRGEGLLERVVSADEHRGLAEAEFSRILVPMKLGDIGEEMIATAVKLAQERGASVEALHVIRVPMELPIDAELLDEEERAEASLAEAKLLGADHGVNVDGKTVRARSIGQAIVQEAQESGADLIVLGSAPRWRRQSRFFSPTVDYVLKKAPSEVLIVAFPQGVLEQDGDQHRG